MVEMNMARERGGEMMGGGGEGGNDLGSRGGKLLRRYLGDPRLFVAPPPQRQLLEGNKEVSLDFFYLSFITIQIQMQVNN